MTREMLYQGEAKKLYATDDPDLAVLHYTDEATAHGGLKRGVIMGKGAVNNRVSNLLFQLLEKNGIPTHLIREVSERESVVRMLEIIPLEVIVRNIAAGSLAARLGLAEGTRLGSTVLEFCYKNDALDDPLVNDSHIAALGLATPQEVTEMTAMALRVNELLCAYFRAVNIELVDYSVVVAVSRHPYSLSHLLTCQHSVCKARNRNCVLSVIPAVTVNVSEDNNFV